MERPYLNDELHIKEYINSLGDHVFFSDKGTGIPLGCYMAWIRAAIDWQGYFLPCPSIQLNEEYIGRIPPSFCLCHISELEEWLLNNKPHDLGFKCSYCNCGKEHNDFIHGLLEEIEDAEFV